MAQKAIYPIDSLTGKMDLISKSAEIQTICIFCLPAWFVQDVSYFACRGLRVTLCTDNGFAPVQIPRSLKIPTKDATLDTRHLIFNLCALAFRLKH